jgi:hypothetical protein
MSIPAIVLSTILFVALFKLGLILLWTTKLHTRHASLYDFSTSFRMMFGPQRKEGVDSHFWTDFEPIQRWNFASNVILGISAAIFVIGVMAANRP